MVPKHLLELKRRKSATGAISRSPDSDTNGTLNVVVRLRLSCAPACEGTANGPQASA
jgi:hypothetical protein